jgi:Uri superfamily endonuclease
MFKKGRVQSKIYIYIGSTFENGIQELDPRESCKYLSIEESHGIHLKNEKEKLKKGYWRRLRLVFGIELSAKK